MKPKILLVDDEATNLKLLRSILQDEYELAYAKNGQTAIKLATRDIDLVLMDVMMPEMDGYEACRQIKAQEESREIPIIFVTALSAKEDELKGFELGAVDYITKPVSGPIVQARIKTHLALRAAYQRLKLQNQALLEAERLKQDVDHIVRHDMKTPLNSIIGFVDLLIQDEQIAVEQRREFLQIIQDSAYKALHLGNLSLGLYKMEKGEYQLTPQVIDLLPIIYHVIVDIRSNLAKNEPVIDILLHGRPVDKENNFMVYGEELLCYSLLANLLKNALEASQKKNITIALLTEETMATVEIHNWGEVPEAIRERFFEKYVTAGKRHGTGLGTYSARLITETQNGNIRMCSSSADGTRITIQLPNSRNHHSAEDKVGS